MIIFAKNLPKLMTKFRYFSLAFCLLLALPAWSQFETKLLEFPEYGFKIPFFKSATRTVYDAGKPEERIEYAFSYTQKGKLFAFLRIYPRAGCYRGADRGEFALRADHFEPEYRGDPGHSVFAGCGGDHRLSEVDSGAVAGTTVRRSRLVRIARWGDIRCVCRSLLHPKSP